MFNRQNDRRHYEDGRSESDRAAQFTALTEIIRTEIRAGVDPLRGDMTNLKQSVDRLERAQRDTYTKATTDLMFKERDTNIISLRAEHEQTFKENREAIGALQKAIGGMWNQAALKVTAVVGFALALIQLWPHIAKFLGG